MAHVDRELEAVVCAHAVGYRCLAMLAKICSITSGLASAAMWIWKSRWISGRTTDGAVWGGRAGVVGASSRTDAVADLPVELPVLAAVPGACFFAFASLSLGGSGTFFSAIMT